MGFIRFLPLMAVATTLVSMTASAQEAGDPRQGGTLAQRECAGCHAVARGEAFSPVPQAPSFETIAADPSATGMALTAFLSIPHRGMPDLILEPGEIDDIVAYILTLKD